MGQSFDLLPLEERAQQYREMADATFLKAKRLEDPVLKENYMSMAAAWHALAQQLEAGYIDPELSLIVSPPADSEGDPPQA